jgi:putative transposase
LKELIAEKWAEREWEIVAVETMPDPVHLFVRAGPTDGPGRIAAQLKGYTSRVLRDEFPHLRRLMGTLWSRSYCMCSVGHVSSATITRYIEQQKPAAARR